MTPGHRLSIISIDNGWCFPLHRIHVHASITAVPERSHVRHRRLVVGPATILSCRGPGGTRSRGDETARVSVRQVCDP